jgi:hypothetical protein
MCDGPEQAAHYRTLGHKLVASVLTRYAHLTLRNLIKLIIDSIFDVQVTNTQSVLT